VPRGAGTGLSGGAAARGAGDDLHEPACARSTRSTSRTAAVVAGGRREHRGVARRRAHGLCYAPDPSSQSACTIGGNVAENSGGPHTLKYGVTTNHVLGVELVLPDGEVVELGGASRTARLRPARLVSAPRARWASSRARRSASADARGGATLLGVFETVASRDAAVSGIIAAGIVPAALEMMDR
jgi:glycolate oxidase